MEQSQKVVVLQLHLQISEEQSVEHYLKVGVGEGYGEKSEQRAATTDAANVRSGGEDDAANVRGGGEDDVATSSNLGDGADHDLCRDTLDYFMASPMRLVFTLIQDDQKNDRAMSVGDMAILAVWIKIRVLGLQWTDSAINPRNSWLSEVLCNQLLLNDLTNFGVLGDSKIVNRLDCTTDTIHRNGARIPTEKDQLNFLKMTSQQDRKQAACQHRLMNVRTRTHLGRITGATWALEAIKTLSKGSKEVYAKLSSAMDVAQLGHTNLANMFPYYSTNSLCNEKENGLWGYVRRTSELKYNLTR